MKQDHSALISTVESMPEQPASAPRRALLQGTGFALGASLWPTLTQAQAGVDALDGVTPPTHNPASDYVFTIRATIAEAMTVGATARGSIRAIPITGGTVEGDRLRGRVVPGGADWQRTRDDGVTELEATYAIELDDQTLVKVVNRGIIAAQTEGERYFRTAVQFTAPAGPHAWLNEALFLCRAGLDPERTDTVVVEVYKLV